MSKPSGNSGKKYTQEAGSFPTPKVMKMTATTAVKTIESQRWICRNQLFQFNETSSDDEPNPDGAILWRRAPGSHAAEHRPYQRANWVI
jgi:hypothetical protein